MSTRVSGLQKMSSRLQLCWKKFSVKCVFFFLSSPSESFKQLDNAEGEIKNVVNLLSAEICKRNTYKYMCVCVCVKFNRLCYDVTASG